ncbi:GNAT family N-acetyltransferase [Roseovarius sp. SCSIO 43702]|uniref:GNAT family N-acetyltransferase n=1 Tax=Roseovarius sp. SCSIO 43702 TaxID=2823043 RepID=UPI001C73CBEB|nr:GNAT family N-acetyltransferase [Roseovarius sp. SCSIO 43702]QYX58394.1 GNAT family N-acetyltransferase [Roseovarius sp. SCSIO 43702]
MLDACPSRPEWPVPLQQHDSFARTLAAMGIDSARHDLTDPFRAPVGTALVVLRRLGPIRIAWLPRGPVWTPGICPGTRRDALIRLRRTVARPLLATFEDGNDARGLRLAAPREMARIDLRSDPAALRAALHGKWRNRLRRAERADCAVTHRPLDPLRDAPLIDREAAQRRVRGYRALPSSFTLAWARANPHGTCLFLAQNRGEITAFMLFLLHGTAATYHAGWSGAEGRAASAHALILWRAMLWLRAQGFTRLDLGHHDAARAPGLARFKRGAGARLHRTGPTCLLP